MSKRARKGQGKRLDREEWLSRALDVLAKDGQAGLRIHGLCDALGVSRGSFYWHFKDREDFIHSLLDYWHREYTESTPTAIEAGGGSPEEKLGRLMRMVDETNRTRYDMAIRSWAIQDPAIARLVRRTDRFRLSYVRSLFAAMGFEGNELEIRARACLSYITLERVLFDRQSRRDRLAMIDDQHDFLVRK